MTLEMDCERGAFVIAEQRFESGQSRQGDLESLEIAGIARAVGEAVDCALDVAHFFELGAQFFEVGWALEEGSDGLVARLDGV